MAAGTGASPYSGGRGGEPQPGIRSAGEHRRHTEPIRDGLQAYIARPQRAAHLKPCGGKQVIDPNRTVDHDHLALGLRRGAAFSAGSLAPKRASRFALSRSISALSASRTSKVFSLAPVSACALATKSSSRTRVVRPPVRPHAYNPATIGIRAARSAGNRPPTSPTTSASSTPSPTRAGLSLKLNTT